LNQPRHWSAKSPLLFVGDTCFLPDLDGAASFVTEATRIALKTTQNPQMRHDID